MKHLSNDHGDHPNQHEKSHKLANEKGRLLLSLKENRWKLQEQTDGNFPIEGLEQM